MRLFTLVRTLLYMTGFVFLWGYVGLALKPYDARLSFSIPPGAKPVGIVLLTLGMLLALACCLVFTFRGNGTPAPFDPPRQFVAVGPYRFVRNPMYIGGLTALLGFALWEQSPSIVLLTLTLAVVFHLFVLFYEEPTLTRMFGDSYLAYKARVARWLPRFSTRGTE